MYPYLFSATLFGHFFRVPTYGVLISLAFISAYFMTRYLTQRVGEDPRQVENIFLIIVVSSAVGGRLFHVLFENFDFYRHNPLKILQPWGESSGFTFYGGLIASVLCLYWYARVSKIRLLNYFDIIAPGAALGVAIGRFGCFTAGCCWGRPTDCFLGVTFTSPDTFAGIRGTPVHPVQLYGSFMALLGFFYMMWRLRHRRYMGQLTVHGFVLYSVLRFIFEHFRGDDYRGFVFGGQLSYSQLISLLILPLALIASLGFRKNSGAWPKPP